MSTKYQHYNQTERGWRDLDFALSLEEAEKWVRHVYAGCGGQLIREVVVTYTPGFVKEIDTDE